MKLSLEEQETIILWDRKYPEATVYTFDPPLKRKLKLLEQQFPDIVEKVAEDNGSVEYRIHKELVSIRKPRSLSEEARGKLSENISKIRQKKRPEEDKAK